MQSIGFIGGDLRHITLLNRFSEDGYRVKIFGNTSSGYNADSINEIYECDLIILPMPSCKGDEIYAPFSDEKIYIKDLKIPYGKTILYAGNNELLYDKLNTSGNRCINYMNRNDLVIKNAIPTAEGALEILLKESPYTVFGSDILILGYGNVAKALASLLKNTGANITVSARSAVARAEIWSSGYNFIHISELKKELCEFNVIFNTIPAKILDRELLNYVNSDSLIIDLASKPGGIDFGAAKELGKNVIWALSLPGKTAPITAGNIIYETICEIITEEGIDL